MSARLYIDVGWQQNGISATAKFDVGSGTTALIGPSGAGKTTLARIIAGLHPQHYGVISLDDRILFHSIKKRNVPAPDRKIGLVMQDAALFPHLTALENIAFGANGDTIHIEWVVALLNIKALKTKYPHQLSGGETKRVAIARALAARPHLLILDEPMNGLDPKTRHALLPVLKAVCKQAEVPILLITHQLEDMLSIADKAILMAPGKAITYGPLEEVIADKRCADLLGLSDAGQLVSGYLTRRTDGLLAADLDGDEILLSDQGEQVNQQVTLRVFASDIALSREKVPQISILNQIPAIITDILDTPATTQVHLELAGSKTKLISSITGYSASQMNLKTGQKVTALIKAVSIKDMG
jgi:molybdate transport system ATP-binding protein